MYQNSLYSLCQNLSEQYSRELTETEIKKAIHAYKLPGVMGAIWSFTGHFYKWPQALLTRNDLSKETRVILEENLQDELGHNGTLPHTRLFMDTARSMGVILDDSQPPSSFMSHILQSALELPISEAIGAFFANESLAKWGGFVKVFSDNSEIDMTFFDIHANETGHSLHLLECFVEEDIPGLLKGVIDFSKSRAAFMNEIRSLLTEDEIQIAESEISGALAEALIF